MNLLATFQQTLELQIPGMQLLEEIGRGADSIVYRGMRDGVAYAVKVHPSMDGGFSPEVTLRFRREAAVLARVRHPALATVMEMGEVKGGLYLITEYVDGETLESVLESGALSEHALLSLGRAIGGALAAVHMHGLVHRDVKPQNILIDRLDNACLIDFGLVRQMNGATPHEGTRTFRYCAPEQTGMLKRPVDGRSDLYALGAVLFEAAAARSLFPGVDGGELMRQHAVAVPPDVRDLNPAISPALALIIAKLLAKDPDDRYQTGFGLVADLEQVQAFNAALKAGHEVVLGSGDELGLAFHEMPLVGRETELNQLLECWFAARRREGCVVLLEGETGSGKSRLIRELLAQVRQQHPLVLMAKCADADPKPFAPLRATLNEYVRRMRRLPMAQRRIAESYLRLAADEAAPLLKHFSSSLAAFFADVPDLAAQNSPQDLFYESVAEFLLRLARTHGGAMLILEDIQGLDEASRQVLKRVVGGLKETPLMVVVTVRNDPGDVISRERFLAEITPVRPTMVTLRQLGEEAVSQLITNFLGGHQELDRDFARQIALRTNGVPFAVHEYLNAMLDAGLLGLAWAQWTIASDGLQRLQVPTDVLQLVVRRIDDLGERPRLILSSAAVIGARFRPDFLARVCKVESPQVYGALAEAMQVHVIERVDADEYRFVHDRVQEALVAGLAPAARRRLHQRTAEALESRVGEGSDYVFALARHYARGEVEHNAHRVYETNFVAGLQAIQNYADEEAYSFLKQAYKAMALTGKMRVIDGGEQLVKTREGQPATVVKPPPLPMAVDPRLQEALAGVCMRTGRLAEAVLHLERALQVVADPLQQAELYGQLCMVHLANLSVGRAWKAIETAFRVLERPAPRIHAHQTSSAIGDWLLGLMPNRLRLSYGKATGVQRRLHTVLARCYEYASHVGYFDLDMPVAIHTASSALRSAYLLGDSHELARCYTNYALVMALMGRTSIAEHYAAASVPLADQIGDRVLLARTVAYRAIIKDFCGAAREAEGLMHDALDQHGRWLDTRDYLTVVATLVSNLASRGYTREALGWVERGIMKTSHTSGAHGPLQGHILGSYAASLLTILGRPGEALDYLHQARSVVETTPEEKYNWGMYLTHALIFHTEREDFGPVFEVTVARYRGLGCSPEQAPPPMRLFYVAHTYARLTLFFQAPAEQRAAAMEKLRTALSELRRAAAGFPVLQCHAMTVSAALEGLRGRHDNALQLLAQAEELAAEIDSPWAAFEIARQRARLFAMRESREAAYRQARMAQQIALDHGWLSRERHARSEFRIGPALALGVPALPESVQMQVGDSYSVRLQRQLDALLQVSLALATVLDPNEIAAAVLDEVIRILGAKRAFLFLETEEGGALGLRAGRDSEGNDLTYSEGYSRSVIETVRVERKPVVFGDTEEGTLGLSAGGGHELRSILAVPMILHERLVGVVYLDNYLARGFFTSEDVEILQALSNHIAIALERARISRLEVQVETERQQRALAETLYAVTSALNSTLDLDEVLGRILKLTVQVAGANTGSLLLLSENGRITRKIFARPDEMAAVEIPEDETVMHVGLAGWVYRHQEVGLIDDTRHDPRWYHYPTRSIRTGSAISVPVIRRQITIGILTLQHSQPGFFNEQHVTLLKGIAAQAATAVENARLFGEMERLAILDGLTNVYNRRHFFNLAEREFRRIKRNSQPLSVVMFDIDHFKKVNDTHGHAVGDEALRAVVDRCRQRLRDIDVLGRYGGEEFAVLLPGAGSVEAYNVADRLREIVARTPLITSVGPLPVTISVGFATVSDEIGDMMALVKRADSALYAAKAAGRNCVMVG